jgi:hypothetical protein
MRETEREDRVIRLLKNYYWGTVIFLALLFLLTLFRLLPFFQDRQPVTVTLERYAIMISIIAIPATLKLFAERLRKIPRPAEREPAIKKYKTLSYIRLHTLSAVTLMHIVLFGFSGNMNFLWFTVILFIIFLFCKPSYVELAALTENPRKESKPWSEVPDEITDKVPYEEVGEAPNEETNEKPEAEPETMARR